MGHPPAARPPVTRRVLTVPNALSALRILAAPLFLWLLLTGADGWALLLLAAVGASDWLDGHIARRFSQTSRLGELLDPIADRLYILATVTGLAWRALIPLWLVAALLARELLLVLLLARLRRAGHLGLPVNFVGKAATFNLLYAFPLLLLAHGPAALAAPALPLAWAFIWWGVGLYWLSALLYAGQARTLLSRPA